MLNLNDTKIPFLLSVLRETAGLACAIQREAAVLNLTKGDLSPVTVADFTIQAVVAQRLAAAFPKAVLVAEESAARLREPEQAVMLETITSYVARVIPGATGEQVCDWIDLGAHIDTAEVFWTLDPIDGTKGYRRGGQYAVALAEVVEGRVSLGGLACPGLSDSEVPGIAGKGLLAVAKRGNGAWLLPLAATRDDASPLRVSACTVPSAARMMRSFEAAHTDVGSLEEIAAHLGIPSDRNVMMDSQAKFAVLASGGAELLFRLLSPDRPGYRECIWDQAAGSIVVEEAGGKVTDLHGRALDFSRGRRLEGNVGVLASNGVLHETALEAIAAVTG